MNEGGLPMMLSVDRVISVISVAVIFLCVSFTVILLMLKYKLTHKGIKAYLVAGGVLTVLRILCLWYVNYRAYTHTMTEFVGFLGKFLYPDALVFTAAQIGHSDNVFQYYGTFSLMLLLGSYLWAFPFLLIGHKKR
jgi:hypothetical protein